MLLVERMYFGDKYDSSGKMAVLFTAYVWLVFYPNRTAQKDKKVEDKVIGTKDDKDSQLLNSTGRLMDPDGDSSGKALRIGYLVPVVIAEDVRVTEK